MKPSAPSPGSVPSPGPGALRRVLPPARRFLAPRKGTLLRLAALSLAESVQTFLGGFCVARSMDDGFLSGDTSTGLLWLAAAAVAIVAGAPVIRSVFAQLADLTEPLRDGLVRRAVDHALHGAVTAPERADRAAVSRLTNQTEIARDSFAGLVLTARSFVFVAAGALLGLFSLAPQFLLVVVGPLVLGLTLFAATLRPMAAAQRRYLDTDEALGHRAGAVRAALRDIVACGTQGTAASQTGELTEETAAAARALARWAAVRTLALGVAGQLPVVLLLATVPWLLGQGVTAGALLGALTYLVQSLLPALHTLMTAIGAAGTRLLIVLDRFAAPPASSAGPAIPPARVASPAPAPVSPARRPDAPALEVRSVRVAYGPRARPVLDRLSLRVEDGEHLAVVGPSGIGKSTLTAVIAGALPPDEGSVRLAGHRVEGHHASQLAALRALIPQQAYVFTGTVLDNLRHFAPDAATGAVETAVDALALGSLVDRLGGLDAVVEPAVLSQGERQLLSLGRAYLSPAPLLLLDEATCHLDPAAEAHAEQALAERPGTLLVVAHRLSSALRADRILVLDGTDAMCGTHDELLGGCALYRDLMGHWSADGR